MLRMTAVALTALLALGAAPMGDLKIGDVVADLEIKGIDGKNLKLADYRGEKGKVVVVYFQSEKCPSAIPPDEVKKIAEPFEKEDSKVKFIAVFAYKGDSDSGTKSFAEKHGLKYAVVADHAKRVADHFGAVQVNTTFVLGRDGRLVYRGALTGKKGNPGVDAVQAAIAGKHGPKSDGKFRG